MNIVFRPNIPASFDHLMPKRKVVEPVPVVQRVVKPKLEPKPRAKLDSKRIKIPRTPWTTVNLAELIEIKANKVSDKECGKILGRTAKSCRMAIWGRGLMPEIKARRLEIEQSNG